MSINIEMETKNGVTLQTKDKYCDDNIVVTPDAQSKSNLVPSNIKKGVTILGVEGSDEGGEGKVDHLDEASVVYATNGNKQDIGIPYAGTVATANSVVVRDGNGNVVTATPTTNTHATTKKYVDDTKEPKHTITSTLYTLSNYTPDENNIIELDIGTTEWRHITGFFSTTVPNGTKWYIKSAAAGVTPQKQTKVNYAVIELTYLSIPDASRPYRVIETTIGGSANQFSSIVASTDWLDLGTLCIELPAGVSPAGTLRLAVEV